VELWNQFIDEFVIILTDGGWLMIPLAVLAMAIYWTAFVLYTYFSEHRFYKIKRERLIELVYNPILAEGELGEILYYTRDEAIESVEEVQNRFAEVRNAYLADIDSKRAFLLTMVTTAPLMGLLGTVMGMLTTFSGLAISSGGSTVDQIADGISEALITTQTGLIIAIPAYVMATLIQKRRNELEACLVTMEALSTQLFQKGNNDLKETA